MTAFEWIAVALVFLLLLSFSLKAITSNLERRIKALEDAVRARGVRL